MKRQVLLLCLIVLAWILWLAGMLPAEIALVIMGVGVGVLFWISERETR